MGFGKTRYFTVFSTGYVPKTKRFFILVINITRGILANSPITFLG